MVLLPFYDILMSCDDKKMFQQTVEKVLTPIMHGAAVTKRHPTAVFPKVNLRTLSQDVFILASNP